MNIYVYTYDVCVCVCVFWGWEKQLQQRNRFSTDNVSLDLAFITPTLVGMSFPMSGVHAIYRNSYDDVLTFLDSKYPNKLVLLDSIIFMKTSIPMSNTVRSYRVYNLCSEQAHPASHFHGNVSWFGFDDHTPPNLRLARKCCEDIQLFLTEVLICCESRSFFFLCVCVCLLLNESKPDSPSKLIVSRWICDLVGNPFFKARSK